jgi:hypothetical protein
VCDNHRGAEVAARRRVIGPIFSARKVTMKSISVGLIAAALVVFTGCDGKNSSGGPGATNNDSGREAKVGQEDNSFKLSPPTFATKLKQGETKAATISIKRGKNFDQDVTLKFEGVPKDVSIDPAAPTIKHSEEKTEVMIKAADTAALGDHTVKVLGKPKEGPEATSELKLTVSEK